MEFDTLSTYLGGNTVSGGKLKITGTTFWNSPNTGADNSSGFSGKGAGGRNEDGSYTSFKEIGAFQTVDAIYYKYLEYNTDNFVAFALWGSTLGLSVRCIKD